MDDIEELKAAAEVLRQIGEQYLMKPTVTKAVELERKAGPLCKESIMRLNAHTERSKQLRELAMEYAQGTPILLAKLRQSAAEGGQE